MSSVATIGLLIAAAPSEGQVAFDNQITTRISSTTGDRSICTGDWDGDGWTDFAFTQTPWDRAFARLSNGLGNFPTFWSSGLHDVGDRPIAIDAADLDGDGRDDLVVACTGGDESEDSPGSLWRLISETPAGAGWTTFDAIALMEGGSFRATTLADFNGDGHTDIAASEVDDGIVVLLNDGSGAFTPMTSVPLDGVTAISLASADLDNDGAVDIAGVNDGSGATILWNDGAGSFTTHSIDGVGTDTRSVATGDFDDNGLVDLAFASGAADPGVWIVMQTVAGRLDAPSHHDCGPALMSIAVADVDIDGDDDVLVANCHQCETEGPNEGLNTISVLVNAGGVFGSGYAVTNVPHSDPTHGGPHALATGDIDLDGYPDLVVATATGIGESFDTDSATIQNTSSASVFSCEDPEVSLDIYKEPEGINLISQWPDDAEADGTGGTFISWTENGQGDAPRCRVQRLAADGTRLWGPEGNVPIDLPDADGAILHPDGEGGVYVIVRIAEGFTTERLYAQHYDASGRASFGPTGHEILTTEGCPLLTSSPKIVYDGEEGFYIWAATTDGASERVHVWYRSATGEAYWPEPCGRIIYTTPNPLFDFSVNRAEAGGFIIMIMARSSLGSTDHVYAQRVTDQGEALWGPQGVVVSAQPNHNQLAANAVPDGEGGWVITWYHDGPPDDSVWGARIDENGNALWAPGGEEILPPGWYHGDTIADGEGGAWIAVWRLGLDRDIYLQRVTKNNELHFLNPIPIVVAPNRQWVPMLEREESGNVCMLWLDWRNGAAAFEQDLFYQRVTETGVLLEQRNGQPLTLEPDWQANTTVQWAQTAPGKYIAFWDNSVPLDGLWAETFPCGEDVPLNLADLDGDGSVTVPDLLALLGAWGECDPPGSCPADLDFDGTVGVSDLLAMLANWG